MQKKFLRKEIQKRLQQLTESRIKETKYLIETTMKNQFYQNADNLCIYLPTKNEVDVFPLIYDFFEKKKRVFVPTINGDDMEMIEILSRKDIEEGFQYNKMNILEPISISHRDNCLLFF